MGTTYVLRDGCRSLISTLGASSPGCDMAYLRDSGCGHADLGSAPNDRVWSAESFCGTHLVRALVDLLLLYDSSLITSSSIGLM